MKLIHCLAILVAFALVACESTPKMPVEDALYTCWEEEYATRGIDLEKTLDSLESYMVQQHVLFSNSAADRIAYYERVMEIGEPIPMEQNGLTSRILKDFVTNGIPTCNTISPSNYKESKHDEIKKAMEELNELSPIHVAQIYLSVLSEEDLAHPFYRAQFILTHTFTFDRPNALIRQLPKRKVN
jgi:hypothetical protein